MPQGNEILGLFNLVVVENIVDVIRILETVQVERIDIIGVGGNNKDKLLLSISKLVKHALVHKVELLQNSVLENYRGSPLGKVLHLKAFLADVIKRDWDAVVTLAVKVYVAGQDVVQLSHVENQDFVSFVFQVFEHH
jgi:hypothetical protein